MEDKSLDARRGAVRPNVTYAYTGAFVVASLGTLGVLLWLDKTELAMGMLATAAAKTDGFWFGSRQPKPAPESETVPKPEE